MASIIEYIEARIDRSGGPAACWPWLLTVDKDGYGKGKFKGRTIRPHRVYACIPDGEVGRHTCDNPPCCNPVHIVGGTHQDNADDRVARGRGNAGRGERHGHAKLTVAQVMAIRDHEGRQTQIAAEFNVSQNVVSLIKNRKLWAHV